MISPRIRDTFLMLLGMAALVVYVLACRPSVSPDGTQLVFPIIDVEAKEASVVLCDLNRKTVERLFVPRGGDEGRLPYSAQWLPDGHQVVVNGITWILILPLGSPNPTRFFQLEDKLEANSLILPPPVIGKYQYLAGKSLLRVDLETGEIQSGTSKGECYLTEHGGQVYYIAQNKKDDNEVYELGWLDAEKLTQIPFLQLAQEDCGELTPFLALTRNGSRLALTGQLEDAPRVLLVRGNALEKIIPVAPKESAMTIGNAQWAPNERTVYAAYARKLGEEGAYQFGVLEVPADGGSIRETPLFAGAAGKDDDLVAYFQIALSPDSRYIVTSSVCLGSKTVKPEDHALYLIDLNDPGRNVTKVAIAFPSASESAAGKKQFMESLAIDSNGGEREWK